MQHNWLPEIVRRSEAGPFMREADYDRALTQRVRQLVKTYGLKFDPQVLVPSDDEMVSRLFQAAVDLFVDLGAYNQSTERRILFSRGEILEAVGASSKVCWRKTRWSSSTQYWSSLPRRSIAVPLARRAAYVTTL
jgi:hypothetical protein